MDITTSARVGNFKKDMEFLLQILTMMGMKIFILKWAALSGDAYENSFYLNPGSKQQPLDKDFIGRNSFQQGGNWCKNKSNI